MRRTDLQRLWLVPLLGVMTLGAADNSNTLLVAQAAKDRDPAQVKSLLKQQVDVNVPGPDGTTALHWIARWNDADTARLLVGAGANVNAANRYGATPLWVAASLGNAEVVKTLLVAGADPSTAALSGEPPLVAAALSGSAETVSALLAHGADVNAKESWRGQTALMMGVGKHLPSPDVTKVLLAHGADVHIRSNGGMTALLFAVRQNDLESVRLLLAAGASVDDEAKGQMGALRLAIDNGHYEIAHLLFEEGANVDALDRSGFTPIYAAIRARAGGNPEQGGEGNKGGSEQTMKLLKALLAKGADVNAKLPAVRQPPNFNPDGYPQTNNVQYGGATPFWVASVLADLEVMRLLVNAGADPRDVSMDGTTPLMVAAGLGYGTRGPTARLGGRRLDTEAAVVAAVEQLIEWGNDVNAVNEKGQTALHGAVASASPAVAQLLLNQGARLDQKDEIGRTAFIMADENRTDKYRTNQSLDPKGIMTTFELLRKVSGSN
jgi:ankyrin repeat protein